MKQGEKLPGNDRLLGNSNLVGNYLSKCIMIVVLAKVEFPDTTLSIKAIENMTKEEDIVWPLILWDSVACEMLKKIPNIFKTSLPPFKQTDKKIIQVSAEKQNKSLEAAMTQFQLSIQFWIRSSFLMLFTSWA